MYTRWSPRGQLRVALQLLQLNCTHFNVLTVVLRPVPPPPPAPSWWQAKLEW